MRVLFAALLLCLAALTPGGPAWAQAGPRAADLVQADLLAEPGAIRPGEPFWVGLRLRMKPHWHTYWLNPGDTGLPTEVTWSLPDGFKAGELVWPAPERIPVGGLINYGYEGETMLLARITPPADLPVGRQVALGARANYLVCENECIPGEAMVATTVPVANAASGASPGSNKEAFAAARATLPTPAPFPTRVNAEGDRLVLHVAAPGLRPGSIKAAYFFPFDDTAIRHAAPQTFSIDEAGLALTLTRSADAKGAVAALPGVLRLDEDLEGTLSRQALQIGEPPARPASVSAGIAVAEPLSLMVVLNAAILAFLGGVILNLMPCVFPVLSIKALALVRHTGHGPAAIRRHGFAYTAGVILTFVALAALLLGIRAGGREIGWGFQLQSPLVVAALAALLLGMGLSLSGLVAFGTRLGGIGEGLATRSGLSGSFFTGALATIVATPCTAPFMGTAIGFALTAPSLVGLTIFVALGLGMAAPFLVLTLVPGLITRLPPPGAWMEVLKQALAFPLYATVAWLIFVLSQQLGPTGLFAALIGLVLVGFGLWALGLAATRENWGRRVAQAAALVAIIGLAAAGFGIARDPGLPTGVATASAREGGETFSQARLDQLQAEGRPFFVNLTAAWCITCLVNERTLASEPVQDAMAARRIVYVKGDWTNQNPEITRLLARNGRSGVPLYLYFSGRGEPVVLPQILTEAGLLDSLGRS